jgi:eukaryotic-like serine/threonine-protein kinase
MTNDSLLAQIAEEFTKELRAGQSANIEEYALKYPELSDRIREILPTLMILEGLAEIGQSTTGAPAPILAAGLVFGRYRIEREIGRGGMGIVYEATHVMLEKRIALKVLPVRSTTNSSNLERFFREARTAASLHHTNIVPVFDVGQIEGTPYYAMQYIEGRGLNEILQVLQKARAENGFRDSSGGITAGVPNWGEEYFRWVAGIGIQSADGLAYAHVRKVVHLDIKPSNLLLDKEGVVWIADFGLARRIEEPDMTYSGTLVGTPRYMSPEQAQSATRPVDHRSDIYSLGATLYELLAARPVFEGKTPLDVISQILTREPVALRRLNPEIPSDLATIVMKAMAKAREDRYQSARELADDLERWLRLEPIRARPIGLVGRTIRWCRRNPRLAAVTAIAAAIILALSGIYYASLMKENADTRRALNRETNALNRTNVARRQAERAERHAMDAADLARKSQKLAESESSAADLQRKEALYQSYRGNLLAADLSLRAGELNAVKEPLARCDPSLRGWEWRYLKRSMDMSVKEHSLSAPNVHLPNASGREVQEVAFADDGASIFIKAYQIFMGTGSISDSQVLSVFKYIPEPAGSFTKTPAGTRVIAISPNGSRAFSSTWDLRDINMKCVAEGPAEKNRSVCQPIVSAASPMVLKPEELEHLVVTDTMSGRVIATVHHPNLGMWAGSSKGVALPNGSQTPGTMFYTSVLMIPSVFNLGIRSPNIVGGAFSRDSSLLATWSLDNAIYIWNLRNQSRLAILKGHQNSVSAVCFSPDQTQAASGSSDGTVRLWQLNSGEVITELQASGVCALQYSPDGSRLAIGAISGQVVIVNVQANYTRLGFIAHTSPISSMAFSPDSARLATAGLNDKNINLWDVASRVQLTALVGHTEGVSDVAFSADGARIASGSKDGTVRVWNARGALSVLKGHSNAVIALGLSTHGAGVLSASSDGTLKVWDTAQQRAVRVIDFDPNRRSSSVTEPSLIPGPGSVVISQDNRRFAASYQISESGRVVKKFVSRVLDIESGAQLFAADSFDNEDGPQVGLNADGTRLAVVSRNNKGGTLQLWEAKSGRLLASWTIDENRPSNSLVALSSDGNRIAVAVHAVTPSGRNFWKTAILVFAVNSPRVLLSIPGLENVQSLRPFFLPDRTRIAYAVDNHVHIWDLRMNKEVAVLKGHHSMVTAISSTLDGSRIVTGGADGTVRLWDAVRYDLLLTLRLPSNRMAYSLAVGSDGTSIAAGGIDGTIYLWYADSPGRR